MKTRRDFLKHAAGICVGTAVLRTFSHTVQAQAAPVREALDYDCIIVGAGLAGLAAAYRLRKAGWSRLLILDKHAAAGGICWTKTEHGFRFPMGTTYVAMPDKGSGVQALYDSLPEKWYLPMPEPEDSFFHRGKVTVGATVFDNWENIPGISEPQKADCTALAAWVRRAYRKCEWPIWTNADTAIAKWETKTLREMLLSIRPNCDPWVLGCINSFVRGVFNGNLDEIGGLQGIDMLGDEYGGPSGGRSGGRKGNITGKRSHVVADLVDVLVERLQSERFLFESQATSVEREGGQVKVTFVHGGQEVVKRCAYCVVATGAPAARAIIAGIPDEVIAALGRIRYGSYAVVNLVMKDHTVPINAFDCTLGDDTIDDIYDFTFVQKKTLGIPLNQPPGIYGCYIAGRSIDDPVPRQSREELVRLCGKQVDEMFGPGTSNHVTSVYVAQYERGMPVFHPGLTWDQKAHLMPMLNERIILANDYVQGSPTIEGAIESGWYAGGKIIEAVK